MELIIQTNRYVQINQIPTFGNTPLSLLSDRVSRTKLHEHNLELYTINDERFDRFRELRKRILQWRHKILAKIHKKYMEKLYKQSGITFDAFIQNDTLEMNYQISQESVGPLYPTSTDAIPCVCIFYFMLQKTYGYEDLI